MKSPRIPRLPDDLLTTSGITGLAASDGHLYVVAQRRPARKGVSTPSSELFILDRRDLKLLNRYPFQRGADVHSVCFSRGDLYAVSTATDEVIQLRLCGVDVVEEISLWRPEPNEPRQDLHHLNSLIEYDGELLVSGFGKKEGDGWGSARSGFVLNLTRHQVLASGIDQPHTLLGAPGRIYFCESKKMAVRILGSQFQQTLAGYTRGLGAVGNDLFVATSVGRQVSQSTGLVNNPAELGIRSGHCTVSRLSLDELSLLETANLDEYANEVYDILPVEGTADWPVIDRWRGPAILGLSAALDQQTLRARVARHELDSREKSICDLQNLLREYEVQLRGLRSMQAEVRDQGRRLVELGHEVESLRETAALLAERLDPKTAARLNYLRLTQRVRRVIDEVLPVGSVVLVASKGDDALFSSNGRSCWHFPQTRDGIYSGSHPACSASAVAQLEALRDSGATHFLLPSTMLWWLDFYPGLRQHLQQNYKAVSSGAETCTVYSLRERPPYVGPDVYRVMRSVIERCRDALGREPSILNWECDAGLAGVFPEIAVFSAAEPAVSLPYLDRSVDVVAIPQSDPGRLAEARRVAAVAVVAISLEELADGDMCTCVDWKIDTATGSPSVSILALCDGRPARPTQATDMQVALPDGFRGNTILVRDLEAIGRLVEGTAADVLVFLAAGTVPFGDWLTPLLTLFKANQMLGTAGAKLIGSEGRLFSAGDVVFADASILGFGHGDHDPDAPVYSHVRETDSCPSRLFATRRTLFQEMGGLDSFFRTWPYQVADYCLRAHAQGYRSLFQPESVAVVLDACLVVDRPDEEAVADQRRFRDRWSRELNRHPPRPFHLNRDSWFALPLPEELEGVIPT